MNPLAILYEDRFTALTASNDSDQSPHGRCRPSLLKVDTLLKLYHREAA
jgi:hypothetical protein